MMSSLPACVGLSSHYVCSHDAIRLMRSHVAQWVACLTSNLSGLSSNHIKVFCCFLEHETLSSLLTQRVLWQNDSIKNMVVLSDLKVFWCFFRSTIQGVRSLSSRPDVHVFCRLKGIVTGVSAISKYT